MGLIEPSSGVPIDAACVALNVSRASLYRSRHPKPPKPPVKRAPSPRLSAGLRDV